MNKKIASEIVVGIIVIITLVIGVIFYFQTKSTVISSQQTEYNQAKVKKNIKPTANNAVVDETADWQTYKNNEYGFEITFSDAWKGYKAEEEETIGGIAETIVIQLPTKDPKWANSGYMATPLKILVYTPQTWPMASSDNFSPKYITKNDKYVFAYTTWQDAPSDLGGNIEKALDILQINKVIASFRLIK